jgi:hypothetical protein
MEIKYQKVNYMMKVTTIECLCQEDFDKLE